VRIFLSSTFIELRDHRDRAIHGITTSRHSAVAMEFFPAEAGEPLGAALRHLDSADIMLLLVGFFGGSCVPDGHGSTYTEAELERARAVEKPILTFVRTEAGVWQNRESNSDAREALQRVHEYASSARVTPAYFESPLELEARLVEALDRWEQAGRPGARRVFAAWDEVFGPSAIQPLSFGHPLVGRDAELRVFNDFLAGSRLIAVVSGRGGIGKSKLVRDWSAALPLDVAVLFVRDGAAWHPDVVKEVPVGRVVLIADDAHADADIGKLLALTRELKSSGRDAKAILMTRPSGAAVLDTQLARRFHPDDVLRVPRLSPLPKADSRALAELLLPPALHVHVPYLVAFAGDTPLVLVVAADLINHGVHLPEVTRQDDFRRLVFDRLLDEYRAGTPGWVDWWNKSLDLIAAVGPLAAESLFVESAASFLARPSDEVIRAIDVLRTRGLLSRRGGIHVVPDALADHILEGAAFRPMGEPTGYVQRVFEVFGETHLTEILANAGEAEWQRSGAHGLLTSEIWRIVLGRIEGVRGWELRHRLKSLERSAPYFPDRVIQVVDLAQRIADELGADEQAEVLRGLPPLLRALRFHLEFIRPAVERLFPLAQEDRRAPHSYPDHAARVLDEMASYGRQPVSFNEEMLRVAGDLAERAGAFEAAYTPLNIIDELLEREVELHDSDERSIRISTTGLNYPAVAAVRRDALALTERLLNRPEPSVQVKAFKVLERLVGGSIRMMGRLPAAEEQEWQDAERVTVLDIIERRIETGEVSPVLVHQVRKSLARLRPLDGSSVATRIDGVLGRIQDSDDLIVVRSICTADWDFRDASNGYHESVAHALEARSLAVKVFMQGWPDATHRVHRLETVLRSASDYAALEYSAAGAFANELFADDIVLDTALHHMLANPDGALAQFMPFALSALRTKNRVLYRRFAMRLTRPNSRELFASAAVQVAAFSEPDSNDLAVLATSLRRDSVTIRKLAIGGFGRALATNPSADLASVVAQCVRLDQQLVEEVSEALFRYIDGATEVNPQVAKTFFDELVEVPELGGYHVLATVARLAAATPGETARFLMARLQRSALEGWRYEVVPGSVAGELDGSALRDWPGYVDFLRSLVGLLAEPTIRPEHVANCFWVCGGIDSTHLAVLDELAHAAGPVAGAQLVSLVGKAPPNLATTHPLFVCHVAQALGGHPDIRREVVRALVLNATPRSWSRTLGEAAPVWVSLRDESQQLLDRYPAVADLFDSLRQYAERRIGEDEAEDEPEE